MSGVTPNQSGIPDFKIIDIDIENVASILQPYLVRGSKLTGVSLDDINRSVTELPSEKVKVNLVWLLEHGMKLFDAIVWLAANMPTSHPLKVDKGLSKESIPSLSQVADALFYIHFFLLTQARYPVARGVANPPRVAQFLTNIMGLKNDQWEYVELICSFEAQKFDPAWIKHVSYRGFGQEALSRFGLGVAGYRLFQPFKHYPLKDDASATVKDAYAFAKAVATAPPTWDIHPITRNPAVLTKRGNLNKNLGNLILECFTDEQIQEMITIKMLYAKPAKEVQHKNYQQWKPSDDISGTSLIFPPSS
jgi:hypothetical protein